MNRPEQQSVDFTELTAHVVSSYVAHNSVQSADLPGVIASVHAALQGLVATKAPEPEKPQPAVSIRKSVTPDFLISLEDGKPYKSLKRHLTKRGLTPDQYRAKWDLPRDYPMVAASYAQRRSELAKSAGLGQIRSKAAALKAKTNETVAIADPKPKRRTAAKKPKSKA
jgi:predicted transcriptional regulator